jgi:WS/DGAT/MGAT family acyltransferase
VSKKVAWAEPIPLDDVKAIGKVLDCSVNDVLLSCVAGALRDYLEEKGDETEGVEVRAMVPVNLRPPEKARELGNQFGLVALVLPVGVSNPLRRLYETRRRMQELKNSTQAMLAYGLLAAVGMGPKVIQEKVLGMMSAKATAVMTNVPGPREKLYFAGARVDEQMFWVPQSGNIGMGVSILSYGGGVQFGLITDRELVPDPEAITDRFGEEFEKLLLLTLMEPWDERRDPDEVEQSYLSMLTLGAAR